MPATSRAPEPSTAPTAPSGRPEQPTRRRLLAAALVLALAGGGAVLVDRIRTADAAAAAEVTEAARASLARDVETLRVVLADPARDGQAVATALLRHQLTVLAGERFDEDLADRLLAHLRDAADRLEEASTAPLPDRPQALAVAAVDPVFARLQGLEDQAARTADRFRSAAEEAERFQTALAGLLDAADRYAGETDLASGSDPEATAAAWRAERQRLAAYREAIEAAEQHALLGPLAAAHAQLVDGMSELADAALEDLDQGDLEAHNRRLSATLDDDDPFGFASAVAEARDEIARTWVDGPLHEARAHALGLLTELERLRRATPTQLART